MTYFKVSALLYAFFIGVGAFIWNKSGIVPTMIFYDSNIKMAMVLGMFLICIIGIIQGISYMIYRSFYKKLY